MKFEIKRQGENLSKIKSQDKFLYEKNAGCHVCPLKNSGFKI